MDLSAGKTWALHLDIYCFEALRWRWVRDVVKAKAPISPLQTSSECCCQDYNQQDKCHGSQVYQEVAWPHKIDLSCFYSPPGSPRHPLSPEILNKAKLSYLSAVTLSANPLIAEISSLALHDPSKKSQCISPEARTTFSLAKDQWLPSRVKLSLKQSVSCTKKTSWITGTPIFKTWVSKTSSWKYHNLKRVWNRIQQGLPAGQLSFLLRAGSDTLPTPLNLRQWKLQTEACCDLCSSTSPPPYTYLMPVQ